MSLDKTLFSYEAFTFYFHFNGPKSEKHNRVSHVPRDRLGTLDERTIKDHKYVISSSNCEQMKMMKPNQYWKV